MTEPQHANTSGNIPQETPAKLAWVAPRLTVLPVAERTQGGFVPTGGFESIFYRPIS
jgi:hypothetical protein